MAQQHSHLVWGFDPSELLRRTEFPNDENEYRIRHSHAARVLAIRMHRTTNQMAEQVQTVRKGKLYIATPGMQVPDDPLSAEELASDRNAKIQEEQLARSAACLVIQSCFRGWATRKRYVLIITALLSVKTHRDEVLADPLLPGVKDLKMQEKLRKRHDKYSGYFDKLKKLPPEFSQFCAALIQSNWRRFIVRRAYKILAEKRKNTRKDGIVSREIKKHENAFIQQVAVKEVITDDSRDKAAFTIQRDLIKIRERGDPYQMLKYINPREAQIIDRSLGLHIRFRLGGEAFPPTIYYKIFTHKNMIDMNSFSPRNYVASSSKLPLPRTLFLNDTELKPKKTSSEWYSRIESNDWRPVLDTTNQFSDNTLVKAKLQKSRFHYSKLCRQQTLQQKRKDRQLEWMRQIYTVGREQIKNGIQKENPNWLNLNKGLTVEAKTAKKGRTKSKITEDEIQAIIDDIEETELDQSLINWTRALDFESYHNDWLSLAATAPSNSNTVAEAYRNNDYLYAEEIRNENKKFELNESIEVEMESSLPQAKSSEELFVSRN